MKTLFSFAATGEHLQLEFKKQHKRIIRLRADFFGATNAMKSPLVYWCDLNSHPLNWQQNC